MKHIKSNHTDHLGSSTYPTDKNGGITHHYEYLPSGEQGYKSQVNLAFGRSETESQFDPHLIGDVVTTSAWIRLKLVRQKLMYEKDYDYYPNRYKFSGKEYDEETGYYYFGARYYDPRTSTWLSVDPLASKYPHASPYNYCLGNPVKFIDMNGDSLDIFNQKGQYVNTIDDGRKGYSGMYYRGTDKNGNFTNGLAFNYNDPDEDRKSVLKDGFTISEVSMKDIQTMYVKSGVGHGGVPPYQFAYREGKKDGKLDFFVQNPDLIPANTLSIISDIQGASVAYNPKDYGNFMFGYSMKRLDISLFMTRFGAHFNNMFFGRSDGNDTWRLFDSAGDQRAIKNGYNFKINRQSVVR